jgi:uncharacterized LabA/DUF88 family protein
MDNKMYFFIDGSHLFSAIAEIRKLDEFKDKKLDIGAFSEALTNTFSRYTQATIRATFYFKENDKRLKSLLIIPKATIPGAKNHWKIVECGKSVGAIPDEQLQKLDPKYREYLPRAEKGLDIRLVCDALFLVSNNKASDIVLYINDRDYIPFLESAQNLGANVYLVGLDSRQNIQKDIASISDMYLTLDPYLNTIFK